MYYPIITFLRCLYRELVVQISHRNCKREGLYDRIWVFNVRRLEFDLASEGHYLLWGAVVPVDFCFRFRLDDAQHGKHHYRNHDLLFVCIHRVWEKRLPQTWHYRRKIHFELRIPHVRHHRYELVHAYLWCCSRTN